MGTEKSADGSLSLKLHSNVELPRSPISMLDSTFLATSTSSAPQSSVLQIIALSGHWIDKAPRKTSSNTNETTN